MANLSNIEWTEATWNPATGCTKVSTGCKNCYAETLSKRLQKMKQKKYKNGFEYTEHENELDKPLHWKKSRRIFVNSMSDLFHEKATDSFIDAVFHTMMIAKQHTYQILTKRPQRMKDFIDKWISVHGGLDKVPEHIWLGVSVENEEVADRIDILKTIPCIRFISFEPLLDLIEHDLTGIHWAIVGGESGQGYRPVQEAWVQILKDQCRWYNVAFFFKQWGGNYPTQYGRKLDKQTYDEYPQLTVKAMSEV